MVTQCADDIILQRESRRLSRVDVPIRPKMSRMDGTKITSKLTKKRRQNAMPM